MGRPYCRGCGEPIRWTATELRNRPIMLDVHPDPAGRAAMVATDRGRRARVLSRADLDALAPDVARYRVHADRCPALHTQAAA